MRVNKTRKNTKRSIFDQLDDRNISAIRQPLQPQATTRVYIVDKKDFKCVVQQLTGYQRYESSSAPQNIRKRQRTGPPAIEERFRPFGPPAVQERFGPPVVPVQDDPIVSLYMDILKSCLDEESSGSNGDQFQQPSESHSSQPQVVNQPMPMPYSNGLEQVMSTTYPSPWFSGSNQQIYDAYSFEPPSLQDSTDQPLSPNLTFSSVDNSGVFGPDLQHP